MLLKLFTGPHPSDNLETLFRHISIIRGPLCAVTPDNRSVTAFQRRLAEAAGGSYLGHRVLTMEGLAAAVAAECGPVPGIISAHMRHGLIAEIIRSRLGAHPRYSVVAGYPGFVTLFSRFIEDIRSGRAPSGGPDQEHAAVLSAYESHLQRLGLTDHEGMVALALDGDGPERFAARFRGPLILHGFYDLTGNQFKLAECLIRAFPRSAVTVPYDSGRPTLFHIPGRLLDRLRNIGGAEIPVATDEAISDVRAVMGSFMGGPKPGAGDGNRVQIHCFRGGRAEADWVAGTVADMLHAGECGPEDIMIAARRQFQWGGCMERALRRHGVPVEGDVMRPLAGHPVVRFALNALDASVNHGDEELVAAVQSSGYNAATSDGPVRRAGSPDDTAWNAMLSEVDSPEGYIQSFRRMLDWLGIGRRLDGGGDVARAASECAAFGRLLELADEFAAFHAPFHRMLRADDFARLFRRYIEPVGIPAAPSPAAGVLLTDVNHARYAGRLVVFVTGMDDVSFPAGIPGWSLHHGETGERLRDDYAAEEPLLFYMAAQGAERLYLTFPGIDDEGRDSAMSPYLRELKEAVDPWSEPVPHAAVPGAAWEDGSTNERGSNERLMRLMKREHARADAVLAVAGHAGQGRAEAILRALRLFARYATDRGIDLAGEPSFDPAAMHIDRVFSVTELEQYLECPVRYFLGRIIGLDVEEPSTGDLSAADRGKLVHDILAHFYRNRLERTGRASFSREELPAVREFMRETVDTVFARCRNDLMDVYPAVLMAEKAFIAGWMDAFLDAESGYFEENGFEPCAFEKAFGKRSGEPEGSDGLESAESGNAVAPPLEITGDEGVIHVGGRIDRIDRGTRGKQDVLRVIDYKTGRPDTISKNPADITDGAALQVPLYLRAAAEMMPGAAIHDGRYYSLQNMDLMGYSVEREPLAGPDWEYYIEIAGQRAAAAVAAIGRGSFPLPVKCGDYCQFLPVCRGGRKHGNGGDAGCR